MQTTMFQNTVLYPWWESKDISTLLIQ